VQVDALERSVVKRLVDFLGDCSKHCHTVAMLFSVLTDRGRQLQPLMLFCTLPISMNLSSRRFIVSLVGAFQPLKSFQSCRWDWTTDFVAK